MMEVIVSDKFNSINNKPVAIAIGSFDGLHKGHLKLIEKQKQIAQNNNLAAGIYSFTPHPLKIINPDKAPGYLLSVNQKINILDNLNLDYLFQQKFTPEFARIEFDKFIKNILINKLNIRYIIVGSDFRFGHKGAGNIDTLKAMASRHNFKVNVVNPLKINKKVVSSSFIRKLVKNGNIKKVPLYLGNYFEIEGKVIKGEGIGRKLGFPTANLNLKNNYVLPPPGVYAGWVYVNGYKYKGIGNLGYKPTFSADKYNIEIHILDFSQNIYGEILSFQLMKYIRKESDFDNSLQLKKQINKDILYTQKHLC